MMMMINKVLTKLFKITKELLGNVRIVGGLISSRMSSLFFYSASRSCHCINVWYHMIYVSFLSFYSAPRSYVIVVNLWKPVIHI